MKLALLGADPQTVEFVGDLARAREHTAVWACDLGTYQDDILPLAPHLILGRHWESLLDGTLADAVFVARGPNDDERAEQLRKLAQAGVPVLASHPVVASMLVYYELDMIRAENRAVLVPCLPWRHHPAVVRAREFAAGDDDAPIGRLEQIVFEREIQDRSKRAVAAQFARDVDLVRSVVGDLTKMAALGSIKLGAAYTNLGIQMSGPAGVLVRWSVGPIEHVAGGRMTLVGADGKSTISMPVDAAWSLSIAAGGETTTQEWPDWNSAGPVIDDLSAAIAGRPAEPGWGDARAVEMAESIDRCLEKGRTIELHNESYSEAGTFKGTMTTVGCGLLIVGLMFAVLVGIVQQVALVMGWDAIANLTWVWPYLLLGVLIVFLVMQGALAFAAGNRAETKADAGDSGARDEK